ncbi:MAG: hypothetical protein ACREL3_05830 [Gemmatimonadales bacterium]
MRASLAALWVSLLFRPCTVAAQGLCTPPKDSHEAQLLAAYSVPLAYAFAGSTGTLAPGAVRLMLEGTYLPKIAEDIRTPTICRPGKGPENTDLLFAYPRPRAAIGLPGGLQLEASWVPPVRLNQVKSNLVGFSLARGFPIGASGTELMLRAHGTFGVIQGPITCDDEELADPSTECYLGTRSDDHYHPNILGVEGIFAWSLGGGRVRPFVGAGANVLHPRFQVNFTNQFGALDNTKVEVDMTRGALLGGATWVAASGLGLTGEIYGAPGDAVTGRVALSYLLR